MSKAFLATQLGVERSVDEALAEGWLCFEGDGQRRRLAPIPEGWLELDERQLQRLCALASPVQVWPETT